MAILYRDRILELLKNNELIIESTDDQIQFDPDTQITSDTIELRLSPKGMVYKSNIEIADTLTRNPEELFDAINIPIKGYILKPGHVLFGSALEIICFANSGYIGRISSRGTFSRFGLSITCGRTRVPAGTPHTPDLQIANHSDKPVRIYPYSFILQIQVETTTGTPQPYDGIYPKSIGPVPPKLSDRDNSVFKLLSSLESNGKTLLRSDPKIAEKIVEKIDDTVKMRKPQFQISTSPQLRSSFSILFGILTTIAGGFVVNMISSGEWSYWKYVSVAFASLLLLLLLVIDLLVIFGSVSE
jgi:dCTP deaminase